MSILVLFLIPVLAVISGSLLYQHTGKREILKFDLVQFVYAFVIVPIIYIWLKSFLFVFLVKELNLHLSVTDIFIADTIYTIIFLYVFAFFVIHSLTKSFDLKRKRDPFYDIFQHSEFLHLITSHVVLYVGGALLVSILSTVNVFIPLSVAANIYIFFITLILGFIAGLGVHVWLILTDDEFDVMYPKFEKFVELVMATFFIYNVVLYFIFRPQFNLSHILYWFVFMLFGGFVAGSLFLEKSETVTRFLRKFHYKTPRLTTPLIQEKSKKS